jgi:hypothetical protein
VWISAGRIEVRSESWLSMAAGLIAGDLAGSGAPGSLLLGELAKTANVGEVVARIGPAGLASAFDLTDVGVDRARMLSGEVHAVLTRGGTVLAAIGLSEKTSAKEAAVVRDALAAKVKGAEVRVIEGAPSTLLVMFAGNDGTEVRARVERGPGAKTGGEKPRTPVRVRVDPQGLFDALSQRAKSKDALQLSRSEVAAAELMLGDTAAKVKRFELELAMPPGTIEASFILEYEAAKPK